MQQARSTGDSFGLGWALGASIAVHVLLALLFLLSLTISDVFSVAEIPDEESITFTFAPEDDAESDSLFDSPPPPPTPPTPVVEQAIVPAGQPAEPLPPQQQRQEPPVEFEEPVDEPVEQIDEPQPIDPAEEAGADRFVDPDATDRIGDNPAPSRRPEPQVDMHQALRDFSRVIQQIPRPETKTNPLGGAPKNVFVPDFSQIPSTGYGVGNLEFESRDYDWTDYGRQVYMAIWRAWHNRLYETTDEFEKWAHQRRNWILDHGTQVKFVIERNGQVTGIAQESASGCGPLDASALDALAEVILPPLPDDFPRNREVVHARFLAFGDIRVMKPSLGRLKRMGLF